MENALHSYQQSAYKEHRRIETTLCLFMDKLLWNIECGLVSVVVALYLIPLSDCCVLVRRLYYALNVQNQAFPLRPTVP